LNGERAGSLDASAEELFEALLRHSFEGGMVRRLRVNRDSWRWSSRLQPASAAPRLAAVRVWAWCPHGDLCERPGGPLNRGDKIGAFRGKKAR
jgi:hypothetical protein